MCSSDLKDVRMNQADHINAVIHGPNGANTSCGSPGYSSYPLAAAAPTKNTFVHYQTPSSMNSEAIKIEWASAPTVLIHPGKKFESEQLSPHVPAKIEHTQGGVRRAVAQDPHSPAKVKPTAQDARTPPMGSDCVSAACTRQSRPQQTAAGGPPKGESRMEWEHNNGTCTPCGYFHAKVDGCRHGNECQFCHLCGPDEVKKRKKIKELEKKKKLRDMAEAQGASSAPTGYPTSNARTGYPQGGHGMQAPGPGHAATPLRYG